MLCTMDHFLVGKLSTSHGSCAAKELAALISAGNKHPWTGALPISRTNKFVKKVQIGIATVASVALAAATGTVRSSG